MARPLSVLSSLYSAPLFKIAIVRLMGGGFQQSSPLAHCQGFAACLRRPGIQAAITPPKTRVINSINCLRKNSPLRNILSVKFVPVPEGIETERQSGDAL
jgi:hypothetical protein